MPPPLFPKSLLRWLIAIGVLLALWVAMAPLDEVVRGSGRIVPQARTQVIQHLEGGIIQAIMVNEGQPVTKGQPLFRLHDQTARTARDEQAISQQAYLFRQQRLQAERDGLPTPTFTQAAQYPALAASELAIFQTRRADFQQQLGVLGDQIQQKRLQINEISTQITNLTSEQATAQRQLDINQKLHSAGALSESRLLATQAQVQNITTRLATAKGQKPIVQSELAEVTRRQTQLREERQSKIADELATVNVQVQQAGTRDKSLGDTLTRTTVTAPATGIINRLLVTTVGGVVQPGAVLAELTPTDGSLIVEGKVLARDRARLWNGQPVTIRVSAYDYTTYGSLTGTIRDISADSIFEENIGLTYRVTIALSPTQKHKLLPGMTVDFYVRGKPQTILWQLLKPLYTLFIV